MSKLRRRKFLNLASFFGLMALLPMRAGNANAAEKLRILVGFPVGGGSDHIARILSDGINRLAGISSYVENKGGAGGLIAAQSLIQSSPRVESILLSHDHTISVLPLFQQNGNSKFIDELRPIAGIATFANAFAISAKVPARTFFQYLQWLKTQNNFRLSVGVPAPNSIPEYLVKIISKHFFVDLNPIAYRGSAPMLNDVLGNQISACIASVPELLEYQRTGHVTVLGVMGADRQPSLAQTPTFSELGLLGFEQLPYYGFFGAPTLNKEVSTQIEKIVEAVMADHSTRERLISLGLNVKYLNSEQFNMQVQSYSQFWKKIIKEG